MLREARPRQPPRAPRPRCPARLPLCTSHLQLWLRVGTRDEVLEDAGVAATHARPDGDGARYDGGWVEGGPALPLRSLSPRHHW